MSHLSVLSEFCKTKTSINIWMDNNFQKTTYLFARKSYRNITIMIFEKKNSWKVSPRKEMLWQIKLHCIVVSGNQLLGCAKNDPQCQTYLIKIYWRQDKNVLVLCSGLWKRVRMLSDKGESYLKEAIKTKRGSYLLSYMSEKDLGGIIKIKIWKMK